jgi:hypothetical protein
VLVVALALAVGVWWSMPALTAGRGGGASLPLSPARLIELKSRDVGTARINRLDARAASAGYEARLVGGYMDARQMVLFAYVDPPARFSPEAITLRDQFGRTYHLTAETADIATGENVVYFDAPAFPILLTGARLRLDVAQLDRGPVVRTPVSLSLSAVVTARDEAWGGYVVNMAINYVALAVVSLAYLALLFAACVAARVGEATRSAFLARVLPAVAFTAVAVPTYIAVATLFRHNPVGAGGLQRPFEQYVPAAEVVFFTLLVIAALIAIASAVRARAVSRLVAPATIAAVVAYLVAIFPLAEFANACYVGVGFILQPSC